MPVPSPALFRCSGSLEAVIFGDCVPLCWNCIQGFVATELAKRPFPAHCCRSILTRLIFFVPKTMRHGRSWSGTTLSSWQFWYTASGKAPLAVWSCNWRGSLPSFCALSLLTNCRRRSNPISVLSHHCGTGSRCSSCIWGFRWGRFWLRGRSATPLRKQNSKNIAIF